jgi:TatD DNase family protein
MIDTHAHLTDRDFDSDRAEIVKRAKEAGIKKIICVLIEFDERSTEIFRKLLEQDFIFGAVGIHPHDAKDFEKYREKFLGLLDLPKVVAVGETGLDYHYMHSPKEAQLRVFEEHLRIAKGKNLPVIVHCREASDDCMPIVKKINPGKGVMHCFSGSEEDIRSYLGIGFYVSFAGPLTFKNAAAPKETIKAVPEDRLLLETDCPYLAPQPFRGKRNEPAYVKCIYEEAARLRGMSADNFTDIVSGNVFKLFGI